MAEFVKTESSGTVTVSASGEVDIATVEGLLEVARSGLGSGTSRIVFDLAEVTFIDSSGLGALVRIRNEAHQRGTAVELRDVPAPVQRLLEVTGLAEAFATGEDG